MNQQQIDHTNDLYTAMLACMDDADDNTAWAAFDALINTEDN